MNKEKRKKLSGSNAYCRCSKCHLLPLRKISADILMKRLEFPDNLIRLDFTVYMPSSDQCLPEDSGEDVRKDGDDDEHHEGQDDQGGQAAADVLPTSTGRLFLKTSNGFKY